MRKFDAQTARIGGPKGHAKSAHAVWRGAAATLSLLALGVVYLLAVPVAAKVPLSKPGQAMVTLRGLDKITARITTFKVLRGEEVTFGSLRILMRDCRKAPPEEPPESVAYLEIDDVGIENRGRKRLFTGWMFASSPAISAVEHAIYDVWVIDCKM